MRSGYQDQPSLVTISTCTNTLIIQSLYTVTQGFVSVGAYSKNGRLCTQHQKHFLIAKLLLDIE